MLLATQFILHDTPTTVRLWVCHSRTFCRPVPFQQHQTLSRMRSCLLVFFSCVWATWPVTGAWPGGQQDTESCGWPGGQAGRSVVLLFGPFGRKDVFFLFLVAILVVYNVN